MHKKDISSTEFSFNPYLHREFNHGYSLLLVSVLVAAFIDNQKLIIRLDCFNINSEVKQTAKMKLLPSLFSCVYSRVKLFVLAMNSRRRCSISVCFIYGLEEKNSKSEVIYLCRLPSAVNVMLNLIKSRSGVTAALMT